MIQQLVLTELDRLALRRRVLHMLQLLALVWLIAAAVCAGLWLFDIRFQASPATTAGIIGGIALALAALCCAIAWNSARSYRSLAHSVEAAFPELKSSLITAIEQQPEAAGGEFGYLQTSVIRQAFDHANRHNWEELVSERKLVFGLVANVVLFALFAGALFGAVRNIVNAPEGSPLTALLPGAKPFSMTVEPGNVEVEKGTSLLVLARIQGRMPDAGTLQYQAAGEDSASVRMPASLNDPLFSARIPVVDHPLDYSVTVDQQTSPTYRVTVFEYPALERADAILVYPAFTGLKEKTIEDVRTVSAVVGTQLTLRCKLNKPVQTAALSNVKSDATGEPLVLKPTVDDPLLYQATLTLTESRRLKLELVDGAGRKNKKTEQFNINVLPNQPAMVKPIYPARDLEVSPLEEVDLKVAVSDDFGIRRAGITYSFAGKPLETVELLTNLAGKEKHEITYQFAMETLGAEVDQLLSYHWWAEDFDNEGKPRRTESDMYFAEVRPFEEIFRQGEQQPGDQAQRERQNQQQGQNEQDAQNVAMTQKDIINATWKVIRREISEKLTPNFAEDVEQIRAAQEVAAEKATGMAERLQDEKSQEHLADALSQMATAVEQLKSAGETPAREPLQAALAAEQAAYQSMLKLRAREHEVVRQQQRSQQNQRQNSARSQQQREQLDQLDLRQEENRYETQRSAEEQQKESSEERENRQVLNRLRELARRQHDLNDRLKELQSALEEAKTPKEKEDIRRQLQRLQEEQQQVLQDTDELQSRLDQPESQERMADERQQLEQTREQVRRASDALQQERIGQASAAGAKAEQQFEDLREEFRRRASNQFSTEMQQMRDAARQLETNQQKIAEQLREDPQPKKDQTPSLTEAADPNESITKQLTEQREELEKLQDRMRDTIERAETAEPLLSERLYETARTAREQNLDRLLQQTDRLVRQGLLQEAQRPEATANSGVRQLREGIEKAAEGVLGDETEALRRARQELQQLSRELDQEVQQNSRAQAGDQTQQGRQGNRNDRPQSGANDDSQPGAKGDQEAQQGDGQPSSKKGGQRQSSGQRAGNRAQADGQQPGGEQPGEQPEQAQDSSTHEGQSNSGQRPGAQNGTQKGSSQSRQAKSGRGGDPSDQQISDGQQPGAQQPGSDAQNDQQPGDAKGSAGKGGQRTGQRQGSRQQQGDRQQGDGQQEGAGQAGDQRQPGESQAQNQPDLANLPDAYNPDQPTQGSGQQGKGQQRGNQAGSGQGNPKQGQQTQNGGRQQQAQRGDQRGGNNLNAGGTGPEDYIAGPLTGDRFREWSDRLRDVEEMVNDPQLRGEAARIRERARAIRTETQRHSAAPEWDLVRDQLLAPLTELEKKVGEEVLRRTSKKALVPLDRDPVPPEYAEKTNRYYEHLGSGK
jgi:hypothetical protein